MMKRCLLLASLAAAFVTQIACMGGKSSETSTPSGSISHALSYVDPAAGGYRFVRNPSLSTGNHLVLDLVAPSTEMGVGVAVELQGDASRIVWTRVTNGDAQLVQNGAVLAPGPSMVQASTAGNALQVLVAQPGTGSPVAFSGAILRIALEPAGGISAGTISLSAPKGQVSRADGSLTSVSISVGALTYR